MEKVRPYESPCSLSCLDTDITDMTLFMVSRLRRCAPCAAKVRQRQRQVKRSRDSDEAAPNHTRLEKEDVPISEFSVSY